MGYQELKSSSEANPYKISEMLMEHFKNPKLKFFYIDTYESPLKEIICMRGDNPSGSLQESGLEVSFRTAHQTQGESPLQAQDEFLSRR